jgi:pyroglutamyl-peptidase
MADRKTILVVTGFGAFSGVQENPTQRLIARLRQNLPTVGEAVVHYDVLEVSVECVDVFLKETLVENTTLAHYFSMTESEFSALDKNIICVHLGVDSNAKCVKLERAAFNNMTFRVPDFRNFQPQQMKIEPSIDLDCRMETTWALESLLDPLSQLARGCPAERPELCLDGRYQVIESSDPGRYLCNYIYYRSLLIGRDQEVSTSHKTCYRSLFVHVPPFEVMDEGFQVKFVETLLQQMVFQLRR